VVLFGLGVHQNARRSHWRFHPRNCQKRLCHWLRYRWIIVLHGCVILILWDFLKNRNPVISVCMCDWLFLLLLILFVFIYSRGFPANWCASFSSLPLSLSVVSFGFTFLPFLRSRICRSNFILTLPLSFFDLDWSTIEEVTYLTISFSKHKPLL